MRAILIDPEQRSISEIDLKDDDYREINAILRCDSHTTGAHLSGSIKTGFEAIYVSDDELPDKPDAENPGPRFWFQVDAERDPPSSFPIAGLGLALGTDTEGAGCDVKISVEELTKRITFTQRKFRGFEVSKGRGLVRVDLKAPIIDGREGKQRPESWNAKMLSGEPLITDAQFEKLIANAPKSLAAMQRHDPVPIVKIFLPHVRWILGWIYPDDPDRAVAVMKWGNKTPELADVLLSDIVRSRLGMISPERDKYITLDQPLSYYLHHEDAW